ncbi:MULTISPECIES: hypothetical protein [Okeania]|uniref:hypothetical protein n=1 Tax=Okeania TaxID=1458928 RepID=UPI0013750BEB|nr:MULTISPECIES: hypothetical protein [Okeania]NET16883.1 hypothetical protein [Okeania sp. SIO1H6]NES78513.1 hypothetical protein [Okeania sp. SIO1H4]NES92798.1 hypothetical protein [Okeania sp. SIO2B9]NET22043.1 hypothetical protein [Okeania sp. SIO1H5]NET78495.1 hypothetical protein [Okeania sp. SIO1F9]
MVRVGDRRQPTPNPSGGGEDRRQDKWVLRGGRSGRFVRMIFLPNYAPKILTF